MTAAVTEAAAFLPVDDPAEFANPRSPEGLEAAGVFRLDPSEAAAHDVIFLENRRTPKIVPKGKKYDAKPSEGKIERRRPANAEEEKTIRSGGWVRVNVHGKKPGDSDYKSGKRSKIRPQNNAVVTFSGVPQRYFRDPGDPAVVAAIQQTQSSKSVEARRRARERVREQYIAGRAKFTPENQPRDTAGKFRRVLARLKVGLGDQETEQLAQQIEAAEAAGSVGDYAKAREAGGNIIELVKDVKDGQLRQGTTANLRAGAKEIGKLIAYMPLPQGDPNAKVRFSDLPPASATLVQNMVRRVQDKLSAEDAVAYIAILKSFMSGGRTMTADELSAELNKILRALA